MVFVRKVCKILDLKKINLGKELLEVEEYFEYLGSVLCQRSKAEHETIENQVDREIIGVLESIFRAG